MPASELPRIPANPNARGWCASSVTLAQEPTEVHCSETPADASECLKPRGALCGLDATHTPTC